MPLLCKYNVNYSLRSFDLSAFPSTVTAHTREAPQIRKNFECHGRQRATFAAGACLALGVVVVFCS